MIGRTLGRYRIDAELGTGGMGLVYRAYDTELRRQVALKVLRDTEHARERLLREARSASTLTHPNICTIHEVGRSETNESFIVMEYVEGRRLTDLIPADGCSADVVIKYGVQIASALAHAHAHGVVHRDLKSANVLVTTDERVKVLDFGIAARLPEMGMDAATESRFASSDRNALSGTLAYMAPEVLEGNPSDERSDIWALGVVLYEAASGQLPFQGKTAFDLASAILKDSAPLAPARLPPGLRSVIGRCLAKRPGERYQHAGELVAALEVSSSVMPASARDRSRPHQDRRRNLNIGRVAVAGLVLVALGAAAVALGSKWRSDTRSRTRLSTGAPASANQEANEYFERGEFFLSKQLDLDKAREMLGRALEIDPHFAAARARYAFAHLIVIDTGLSNDTSWIYRAETEIQRALADDPNSVSAHSTLAAVHLYQGRKDLALDEITKALRSDPNDLDAMVWRCNYLQLSGEHSAAAQLMSDALRIDPLYYAARMNLGEVLRELGDTTGAIREQTKVMQQDSGILGIMFLARIYIDLRDLANARKVLELVRAEDRQNFWIRLSHALLVSAEGRRDDAFKELDDEVLKFAALMPLQLSWVTDAFGALGETEKALEWLERGMRLGDDRADWYRRDPHLKQLRAHPRFKQILDSMDLRRAQRTAR